MMVTPVGGTPTTALPKVDAGTAQSAVAAAADAHRDWLKASLAERRSRVTAAVDALADARDDLAPLPAWEIGKPWRLACADVDRALDGARWYLEGDRELGRDVDGAPYDRRPFVRAGQQVSPVGTASRSTADRSIWPSLAERPQAFKVGINTPRSRGDMQSPSAGAARHGRERSSAVPTSCRP